MFVIQALTKTILVKELSELTNAASRHLGLSILKFRVILASAKFHKEGVRV